MFACAFDPQATRIPKIRGEDESEDRGGGRGSTSLARVVGLPCELRTAAVEASNAAKIKLSVEERAGSSL